MLNITEERKKELAKLFFSRLAGRKDVDLKDKDSWSFLVDHLYNSHFAFERYVPHEVLDIPLATADSEDEAYQFASDLALACLEKRRKREDEMEKEKKLRAAA